MLEHYRLHLNRPVAFPVALDALRHGFAELSHQSLLAKQRIGQRYVAWHRNLMLQALIITLEGCFEGKDRLPVLNGDDPPRGKRSAIPDPVDLVDDRQFGIARPHEIAMKRMNKAIGLDSALSGDERLGNGLAAKYALPAFLGAATTEQVVFQPFEVKNGKKFLHCG